MKNISLILLTVGITATIAVVSYFAFQPRWITAHVTLKNNCEIITEAFAIRNMKSNEIYPFIRGKAEFDILRGTNLRLVFSQEYKDVEYFGPEFTAVEQQTVTADCSPNTWSLKFD